MPGAALALIPAAMKAGTAAYQALQARKLRKQNPRPTYQIPAEAFEAAAAARENFNDPNLYGRNIAARQLSGATSAGANRAMQYGKGGNEVLATIAALNNNEAKGLESMAVAGDQARSQRMGQMNAALGNTAAYKDLRFEQNQMYPYMEAHQAAGALAGASIQNFNNAIEDGAVTGYQMKNPGKPVPGQNPYGNTGSMNSANSNERMMALRASVLNPGGQAQASNMSYQDLARLQAMLSGASAGVVTP